MTPRRNVPLAILVVDIGGSHVKCALPGRMKRARFVSGPTMTPAVMVRKLLVATRGWQFDAVSIGYPGVVRHDKIIREPKNLGPGWIGHEFRPAFNGVPVRMINDAAMQALGAYNGGRMLFLGFGTGLGSALVFDDLVVPMELGYLDFRDGSYEDAVGDAARRQRGQKAWAKAVRDVIRAFREALLPDYVVIGGGNARHIERLPPRTQRGSNSDAFRGGLRLWERELPRDS